MGQVAEHFDKIGQQYDYFKQKNWYYYKQVKNLYREQIPAGSRVLEIGCGTGDVLASVEPSYAVGIDISSELVSCAQRKYLNNSSLRFISGDCGDFTKQFHDERFDYIFMSDVIEHLEDVDGMIKNISEIAWPETKIIISMGNPVWEPILMLLEKLKLKMPEGPHKRIGGTNLEKILKANKFSIIKSGERALIPANIPGSDWINNNFHHVPVLKKAGLIYFWVCQLLQK